MNGRKWEREDKISVSEGDRRRKRYWEMRGERERERERELNSQLLLMKIRFDQNPISIPLYQLQIASCCHHLSWSATFLFCKIARMGDERDNGRLDTIRPYIGLYLSVWQYWSLSTTETCHPCHEMIRNIVGVKLSYRSTTVTKRGLHVSEQRFR